jgi:hypothetical protein
MPFLMVNLDDAADCRRAMRHLNGILGGARGPGSDCDHPRRPGGRRRCEEGPMGGADFGGWKKGEAGERGPGPQAEKLDMIRDLPLPAKLERLKQRGLWKHLVAIAKQGETARSLAEFDKELALPQNKMRSLKAIMAKLENRFGLQFLDVNLEAGQDEAGNPRYSMPHRIRKQILRVSDMP